MGFAVSVRCVVVTAAVLSGGGPASGCAAGKAGLHSYCFLWSAAVPSFCSCEICCCRRDLAVLVQLVYGQRASDTGVHAKVLVFDGAWFLC